MESTHKISFTLALYILHCTLHSARRLVDMLSNPFPLRRTDINTKRTSKTDAFPSFIQYHKTNPNHNGNRRLTIYYARILFTHGIISWRICKWITFLVAYVDMSVGTISAPFICPLFPFLHKGLEE